MSRKPARRMRADDRIISSGASSSPGRIRCDLILAPLDRLHREMDLRWGIDQLVSIMPSAPPAHVPPEQHDGFRSIVGRYGELVEALNVALDADDAEGVQAAVPRIMRAIQVMDFHCTTAGLLSPVQIFEVEYEGKRIGLIADAADWQRAEAARPGLTIHTFREAAAALLTRSGGLALLGTAAALFPGAEVVVPNPRDPRFASINDEIPF
jgi:hypothetical protein